MSVLRYPIIICVTLLLNLHKTTNNLIKIPSLSPTVQKPALFLSPPTTEKTTPPSEIDIMDFYAPLHPFEGEKMELSCGYKVTEDIRLQHIEWYRVTDTHQVRLNEKEMLSFVISISFCSSVSPDQDRGLCMNMIGSLGPRYPIIFTGTTRGEGRKGNDRDDDTLKRD